MAELRKKVSIYEAFRPYYYSSAERAKGSGSKLSVTDVACIWRLRPSSAGNLALPMYTPRSGNSNVLAVDETVSLLASLSARNP